MCFQAIFDCKMSTPKEAIKRTLLGPFVSWEETKESLKKQEAKARELDNQRIKEKELVWLQHLEKNAADVPDLVDAGRKEQEEFVNTDDTETTDDGFARADGLMMDPLDILNQCEVILDQKELEDAKARKLELEKVTAMQKNKKSDKRRRGKH